MIGSIDHLGSRFRPFEIRQLELVTLNFASWNRTVSWLRQLEAIRAVA